jgi:inosine/xanthosine triphosphatase
MKFFVASTNPVKINAVKQAISQKFPDSLVQGLEVESGIAAQPMSDQETKQGALNRAQAVKKLALRKKLIKTHENGLFIGLEGGVFHPVFSQDKQELWSTVWAVALDQNNQNYFSNGARFPLPSFISQMLLNGQEMGPALGAYLADPDLKSKAGAIGFLTKSFTNRTDEYESVVKIAIGLWYKVYSDNFHPDCDLTK